MFDKFRALEIVKPDEPGVEVYLIVIGVIVAFAVASIIITKIVKNKRR